MIRGRYFLLMASVLLFCSNAYSQYVYPDGPFTLYWPTISKPFVKGAYKASKTEGTWTFYKFDTTSSYLPSEIYTYKNGILNGEYLEYSKDTTGRLIRSGYYLNNMKNGTWKKFNEKGEVRELLTYRNDTLYGPFQYGSYGESKGHYVNAKMHGKVELLMDQNTHIAGFYNMDIREGEWSETDSNGIKTIKHYVNDLLNGPFHSFYIKDSLPIESGIYKNNLLEGNYSQYQYKDLANPGKGFFLVKKQYKNGQYQSYTKRTFGNGRLISEQHFIEANINTDGYEWDSAGMLNKLPFYSKPLNYDSLMHLCPGCQLLEMPLFITKGIRQYSRGFFENGRLRYRDSFYRTDKDSIYDYFSYDTNGAISREFHFINGKRHGRWFDGYQFHLYYDRGVITKSSLQKIPEGYEQYVTYYFRQLPSQPGNAAAPKFKGWGGDNPYLYNDASRRSTRMPFSRYYNYNHREKTVNICQTHDLSPPLRLILSA